MNQVTPDVIEEFRAYLCDGWSLTTAEMDCREGRGKNPAATAMNMRSGQAGDLPEHREGQSFWISVG